MSKKYLLFIVEGITDVASLGLLFHKYFSNEEVEFQITHGDITTKKGNSSSNILIKLSEEIKAFTQRKSITKKHISEVVHIIDTDGAFIDNQYVIEDLSERIKYDSNCIKTNSVNSIIARNMQKKSNINVLYSKSKIMGTIPYSMYYFSCNLEDFFHNKKNATLNEKNELANELEDKYYNNVEAFIDFICQNSLSPNKEYLTSWEYIKDNVNSLSRCGNLNIFIKKKEEC